MWSCAVVVTDVDAEDVRELAAADDQHPVEALAAYGSDPALHVSVGVGRLNGSSDDLDVLAFEESVEGAWELGIAVVDQESHWLVAVVELHEQVACLLQHPCSVRLAGAADVLHSAAADREKHEHVQAAQPDRVDGEEVAGEDRLAVRSQESAPGLAIALRCWPALMRMLRTEVAETVIPSLRSSPTMRR
jgi:hypothetical protein